MLTDFLQFFSGFLLLFRLMLQAETEFALKKRLRATGGNVKLKTIDGKHFNSPIIPRNIQFY